jgi:acetyltransferase-like isoleucine patch superfamily enzyme
MIGVDCHFNGLEIIGKGIVTIGDHFHSGSGIMIITQNHDYYSPEKLPYDENDIVKDITIGRCCWIGSRVIILPGTILEDGVVVQAGAVVFGRIPKGAVIGGNPAKIIKYRDLEKYELLDRQKLYV